jgi:deazaflavin-dependent oxidoreductase (nitroreductase family)
LAGKRWNPVFAVVIHQGRKSGRQYETTVAARRVADGFVISLAFGPRVDWYRNVMAAGRATIRWRDSDYPVASPAVIDAATGRAAFHPIQRLLVRLAGIDGYIRLHDVAAVATAR